VTKLKQLNLDGNQYVNLLEEPSFLNLQYVILQLKLQTGILPRLNSLEEILGSCILDTQILGIMCTVITKFAGS
jgi:hypothetical protein